MKSKRSISLLLLLLLLLLFPVEAEAKSSVIHDISIHIELLDNGEALVEEVWEAEVYEGTEVYLVKERLSENQMSFTDLHVSDETGRVFTTLEHWDTSASRQEKAYKAGYNYTSNGVELCFGIGDYGNHTYRISYRVKNFLVKYSYDTPGFHVRVVNDKMSSPIHNVNVTIEKDGVSFDQDNAKIWAFGYEGEIVFEDGKIEARSFDTLDSHNYVNILASFSPELFEPAFTNSKTFEQVKDTAMVGSDYGDRDEPSGNNQGTFRRRGLFQIIPYTFFFAFGIIFFVSSLVIFGAKAGDSSGTGGLGKVSAAALDRKVRSSKEEYHRDTPFDGDLAVSYRALAYTGKGKMENLISALILSWLRKGYIHLQKVEDSSFFGLVKKEETSIGGLDANAPTLPLEKRLYSMMMEAAGSDRILQEKEFYKWSRKEYSRVTSWHKDYLKEGESALQQHGYLTAPQSAKILGLVPYEYRDITELGLERVGELVSFQHFLDDFTLVAERESLEVEVWEEYLIYAALFGIAERVAEELEKHQPDVFKDSAYGDDYSSTIQTLAMVHYMSSAMSRGTSAGGSSSSSGGGGFSSSGGGGGFSGGGSGGGFR